MDRAEFFDEQSEIAKAAIASTIRDAKADALRILDPEGWVKTHPWKTLAAAAATGFLAAKMMRGSPASPAPTETSESAKPPRQSGMSRMILRLLKEASALVLTFAKPLAEELIKAHTASGNGASHHDGAGQHPSQSPNPGPAGSPPWPSGR